MRIAIVAGVMALGCGLAVGQAVPLEEAQVREHLSSITNPAYPPIALAAHVAGRVVLQIVIGKDGHVAKIDVLSGPAMLRAATIDAVKHWDFTPFAQGEVTAKVVVPFVLPGPLPPDDAALAKEFFPASDRCHALVSSGKDVEEQASVCGHVAELADKFPARTRFIERRGAYVFCATAMLRAGKVDQALSCGNEAVAVVLEGHDDASGTGAAYTVRAQAEMRAGDLVSADRDVTTAVKSQREALAWSEKEAPDLSKSYRFALKLMLNLQAQVYEAMGKPEAAKAARDEALTY